jgi:hypothetical protein
MPSHPLDSPREKVKRANHHIKDLEGLIRDFLDSKPYEVFIEEDVQAGRKRHRLRIRREPPPSWGPVIGEVLFNLRSALDHLACQLVILGGGPCTHETEFPVAKNRQAFESRLGSVKGAGKDAIKILRACKPYSGGNDLLWSLHQLNRVEKHRFPLVAFASYRNLIFNLKMTLPKDFPGGERIVAFPPLALIPADRGEPLVDGAELYNEPIVRDPDMGDNPQATIEIAFGEPGIPQGEPLLDALHQIVGAVEGVVNSFEPLFPQPSSPRLPVKC